MHAKPASAKNVARFDTVLVNEKAREERADMVGIDGLRVARVRTVFQIPSDLETSAFGADVEPPAHLAVIEWFTPPQLRERDPDHRMYPVTYSVVGGRRSKKHEYAIVELNTIRHGCQLLPDFGETVNRTWTSSTVLDDCDRFFVNNWRDHLTYQTIY